MRAIFRCPRGARSAHVAAAFIFTLLAASANASSIAERAAPFRVCLDSQLEKWVNARAELVVNEDPKAGDIDDAAAAKWAVSVLEACRIQTGGGDKNAEAAFTKRVAQWRQHIYDRVQSIRELTRPD